MKEQQQLCRVIYKGKEQRGYIVEVKLDKIKVRIGEGIYRSYRLVRQARS